MTLTQADLDELRGLNDRIDLAEVEAIYLPLSRLLNLYVAATQELFRATNNFLHIDDPQSALCHRHGGQRRGRQEHHGAHPAAAAGALAQASQGRSGDHRRFSPAQCGARARRA